MWRIVSMRTMKIFKYHLEIKSFNPNVLIVFVFLYFSWIMWWCNPRPERNDRIAWLPPRLSQLRQLYVADNNRGAKQDPAHLRHARTRGRLWYGVCIWWTTFAWELKNEVRIVNSFFVVVVVIFSVDAVTLTCKRCQLTHGHTFSVTHNLLMIQNFEERCFSFNIDFHSSSYLAKEDCVGFDTWRCRA